MFSSTAVQISTPSPTASVNPDWFDHGPISLGAKVGIAIGGLVALLIVLGCCVVMNGKRRRKAYLRRIDTQMANNGWPGSPTAAAHGEMGQTPGRAPFRGYDDTPLSQRPLRGWDDSPMTANSDKTFPRTFSPYSSQYNSPVSAQDMPNIQWPPMALGANPGIGVAVSPEGSGDHRQGSKDAKGKGLVEFYEMHEVEGVDNGSGKTRMDAHQQQLGGVV
jgi:hypothetical protein